MKITKEQLDKLVNQLVKEQFEWTDEELSDEDEWFSNFTGEMTGLEDDESGEEPEHPWDDEFVGKADAAERVVGEAKKKNRCWDGYKPVKGKAPYSKGSCEKVSEAKKKKSSSPADKVRKPTAPPSRQHKDPTKYDRKRDKKNVDLNEMRPMSRRGSMMSGKGEQVIEAFTSSIMKEVERKLGGKGGKFGFVDEGSVLKLKSALRQIALQAYGHLDDVD